MREAILSGIAGAALGALVTLIIKFGDWRRQEKESRKKMTERLEELANEGERFRKTFAPREQALDEQGDQFRQQLSQQEEHFRQQLSHQVHELEQREQQLHQEFAQRSRELDQQEAHLQRNLEHQTREALREGYTLVLVTQRRCREACLQLAEDGGAKCSPELAAEAKAAHDEFLDAYHMLNLDSTKQMWEEVRGLRHVLDDMLDYAEKGRDVKELGELARDARQNLERMFRERLGYQPHQDRQPLGKKYDKVEPLRVRRVKG
jgi:gas vesicle protein